MNPPSERTGLHRRAVLGAVATLFGPGCIGSENDGTDTEGGPSAWPSSGFDRRNRGNPNRGTIGRSFDRTWSFDLQSTPATSPVAADGTIYLADRDRLRGISLDEGESTGFNVDATVTGTPVVDEELVVPTKEDAGGRLLGINLSGSIEWTVDLPGGRPFSPSADEEGIVVRTLESANYVRRDDDTILWSRTTPTVERAGRFRAVDSSPALLDDLVVVPGPNGLRCRDRQTGDERWHDARGRVVGSPAVDGETVFASFVGTGIVALDVRSGEERWSVDATGCWTSPAVGTDAVYATAGFEVLALDRDDGDTLWRFEEPGLRGDCYSNPVALDTAVVTGSIGRSLTVLDSDDGERLFSVDGDGTHRSPAVVEDMLLVPNGSSLEAYQFE